LEFRNDVRGVALLTPKRLTKETGSGHFVWCARLDARDKRDSARVDMKIKAERDRAKVSLVRRRMWCLEYSSSS